jgi:hypothetical protein
MGQRVVGRWGRLMVVVLGIRGKGFGLDGHHMRRWKGLLGVEHLG